MATESSVVRGLPLSEEPGLGAATIPGYLDEVAARWGEREALVGPSAAGEIRWSYRELRAQAMAVARALVACGLGRGGRVGILMTNRAEFLTALFGTAQAGGVAVALSTFSTPGELAQLLAAAQLDFLLFEERVLARDFLADLLELEPAIADAAPGRLVSARFPWLRRLVALEGVTAPGRRAPLGAVETWEAFLAAGEAVPEAVVAARAAAVHPADPAGVFFSSGTTSRPKGILHAQRAFAIQWWRWPRIMDLEGAVRAWTGNGFFWSGNISMIPGVAFTTGGAVILQPVFEPRAALELIARERVAYANGRPHQWARMAAVPGFADYDLSSLKYITRGEILWEHPKVSTRWTMPMAFGTTETMSIMTSEGLLPREARRGTAGPPLPGNVLRIVDPETGEVLPRGARGEICVKGPTTMIRYLGKAPEECFDEEGFYRTGDGGFLDEQGCLHWEGRLTALIKTGGANVSPEEVDEWVARFPGVKRTQTVGVPHETLGEMVVTCVVPVPGVEVDTAALTAWLRERLAAFKVPRAVLLFAEEEFPLTGNEKVKVAEVRRLAAAKLEGERLSAR
ncbi:MAG: AMP-binding protein [Porticoccaceae bacterium]|nr:MAG: AMP-binding protein [Porticoccaceae bacterium]